MQLLSATPCSIRSCGDMEEYIVRDGKRLRLGYTTGTCAAAAAQAAALMLLTGRKIESVSLTTPKGIALTLPVEQVFVTPDCARCAVRKDAGDDPDVTDGALIFAEVCRTQSGNITIDGGAGVGRVTRRGLDQPVGAAAINSVPRQMITDNVAQACRLADYHGGLHIIISVPGGETLAKKTFNPRLGIEGGISILGTTGIVEPMSEQALVDTIRVELRQRRADGAQYVLLTPGNYGAEFIQNGLGLDPAVAVQTSNFIGETLDMCRDMGFCGALLVGHIGKLVKIAGGMLNTHSKYGDCRMEILAAYGGAAGLAAPRIAELLQCVSCDDALRVLDESGLRQPALDRLCRRISFILNSRSGDALETGAIVFSRDYGLLCQTENAQNLLDFMIGG